MKTLIQWLVIIAWTEDYSEGTSFSQGPSSVWATSGSNTRNFRDNPLFANVYGSFVPFKEKKVAF